LSRGLVTCSGTLFRLSGRRRTLSPPGPEPRRSL
jgi:hypothetical protein